MRLPNLRPYELEDSPLNPVADFFDPIVLQVTEEGMITVPAEQFIDSKEEWIGVIGVRQIVELAYKTIEQAELVIVTFGEDKS